MVSKKLIKSYDFEKIEDYFNYIIDSKINGQPTQARELYKALSNRQKDSFHRWYLQYYWYDAIDNDTDAVTEHANLLTYLNS